MKRSFPSAQILFESMGYEQLKVESFEADDIIGTVNHLFKEKYPNGKVYIV